LGDVKWKRWNSVGMKCDAGVEGEGEGEVGMRRRWEKKKVKRW
jgi:hypothetical protein